MINYVRIRFWLEAVIGGATATLGIVTLVWHDWIEAVFGTDPDQHNGSVEWLVVAALLAAALALGGLARADWKRLALRRLASEAAHG
jgi:hypothetical protein